MFLLFKTNQTVFHLECHIPNGSHRERIKLYTDDPVTRSRMVLKVTICFLIIYAVHLRGLPLSQIYGNTITCRSNQWLGQP